MAQEGYVKFEYFSKSIPPYYNHSSYPELLDDEKITIETPCLEMSYHQYAGLFKKFLMAVGFDEKNVMQAGCSLAFNEGYNEKLMREVAEEYDLIMSEDLPQILEDRMAQEERFREKQETQYKAWDDLVPGSDKAIASGCMCPVMDNAEMPEDRKWVNANCPLHGHKE